MLDLLLVISPILNVNIYIKIVIEESKFMIIFLNEIDSMFKMNVQSLLYALDAQLTLFKFCFDAL